MWSERGANRNECKADIGAVPPYRTEIIIYLLFSFTVRITVTKKVQ
jgi:hypothetical protein